MKSSTIILCLLNLLFFSSCVFYQPALVDIPLIKQKNELHTDIGVSLIPAVNATVSYGLTNHIALQTFATLSGDEKFYVQGAFGLFKPLADNHVLEWYNGFGFGNGHAYNDANPGHLTGNYRQYFTQVNYGKTGYRFANMDFGVALKAGYLVADSLIDYNYFDFSDMPQTNHVANHSLLIEPQAFIRLGGKHLKFSVKAGYGMLFKLFDTDVRLPAIPFNLGIGLNYTF